jgi:hypothetical protein
MLRNVRGTFAIVAAPGALVHRPQGVDGDRQLADVAIPAQLWL